MSVLDFSILLSDVHSPLDLSLDFRTFHTDEENISNGTEGSFQRKGFRKWDSEKEAEFVANIDKNKLELLDNELTILNSNILDQEKVNKIVENINDIMLESAETVMGSFMYKSGQNKSQQKDSKPWFDKKCWEKRRCFRIAKRRYRFNKTYFKKQEMNKSEREYKKQMDLSIREHRKNIRKKMNDLKHSNSKEFWKILNSNRERKKSNIPINILFDFFRNLNSSDPDNIELPISNDVYELNVLLNNPITENEIFKCIKDLKNGKACGDDHIINEYIKSTSELFMPVYVKLFNIVLDSGCVPDLWLVGNIIPFYKNKGDQLDPQNYRPITILSCMGKLFTSVLNFRLSTFLEEFLLLNENQFGFRKGYSTIDSIFVLHLLFELLKLKKKKLFCAFIDFAKAFDTVWRSGLWSKLLLHTVNGKVYNIIVNMYSNIKSRIFDGNEYSDFFPCEVGVRQGENLSPVLFAIYLNDLESFFSW